MTPGMLHHVEIYVHDLVEARAFWEWFLGELGYVLHQDWAEGFSMRLGPTALVFVQTAEAHLEPRYHRCRTGLNHLAFHAASKEAVDAMTTAVQTRGMRRLYEDRHPFAGGPAHYALFFEGPDRVKIELVAPLQSSADAPAG